MPKASVTADQVIAELALTPHPEGGHYRQTYRAADMLPVNGLPTRYEAPRVASTAIYFLLRAGELSHLHRLRSDEVWHFYRGQALDVHVIAPGGAYHVHRLGRDLARGERPQLVVPHGCWFGAELASDHGFALVGNTVAPGFDFADFELAEGARLAACYPRHAALIERMSAR